MVAWRMMAAVGLLFLTACETQVWTQARVQTIPLEGSFQRVQVETTNGRIKVEGRSGAESKLTARLRGGGADEDDARAALDAIEVIAEQTGDAYVVRWQWSRDKRSEWGAKVQFDLVVPPSIAVEGTSHNGPITVDNVAGPVKATAHNGQLTVKKVPNGATLETHNGAIDVDGIDGRLAATTHNGSIRGGFAGSEVQMSTRNGSVKMDLSETATLDGRIETHNGTVALVVGAATSTKLDCRSHNGSVAVDFDLADAEVRKRMLRGTVGSGAGNLQLETHNGGIRVRRR